MCRRFPFIGRLANVKLNHADRSIEFTRSGAPAESLFKDQLDNPGVFVFGHSPRPPARRFRVRVRRFPIVNESPSLRRRQVQTLRGVANREAATKQTNQSNG